MKSRKPTPQEIKTLVAFLPNLYAPGLSPVKEWHGGDKNDEGIITIPWPEYQPIVEEFFRIASSEWWTDYEYQSKSAWQILDDEEAVNSADLEEIKTMLTYCVRGERFCTGHWGAVIESGCIRQLLQRLAALALDNGKS